MVAAQLRVAVCKANGPVDALASTEGNKSPSTPIVVDSDKTSATTAGGGGNNFPAVPVVDDWTKSLPQAGLMADVKATGSFAAKSVKL